MTFEPASTHSQGLPQSERPRSVASIADRDEFRKCDDLIAPADPSISRHPSARSSRNHLRLAP